MTEDIDAKRRKRCRDCLFLKKHPVHVYGVKMYICTAAHRDITQIKNDECPAMLKEYKDYEKSDGVYRPVFRGHKNGAAE